LPPSHVSSIQANTRDKEEELKRQLQVRLQKNRNQKLVWKAEAQQRMQQRSKDMVEWHAKQKAPQQYFLQQPLTHFPQVTIKTKTTAM